MRGDIPIKEYRKNLDTRTEFFEEKYKDALKIPFEPTRIKKRKFFHNKLCQLRIEKSNVDYFINPSI